MTIKEFDNQQWYNGLKITHANDEGEFLVGSVDFEERLIGYVSEEDFNSGDYEYSWPRCENCTIKKD